jgi:hypothetical protein
MRRKTKCHDAHLGTALTFLKDIDPVDVFQPYLETVEIANVGVLGIQRSSQTALRRFTFAL